MNDVLKEINKLSPEEKAVIALKIQQSFEYYDEDFSPEELAIIEERLAEDERGEAVYVSAEDVMSNLWLKYNNKYVANH